MTEVENSKNESTHGGKREGSGRKPGGENEETKRKKVVKKEMEDRIIGSVDNILNAQMNLAIGVSFLLHVTETEKGKKKTEIVTEQKMIEDYFAGKLNEDEYYYMTTKKPDNRAIDSLFDRAFGKPKQPLTGGDEDDMPITVKIVKYGGDNDSSQVPTEDVSSTDIQSD